MKKAIYRIANFVYLTLKFKNPFIAFKLSKYRSYQDFNIDFKYQNGKLKFKSVDFELTNQQLKSFSFNLFEITRLARNKYLKGVYSENNNTIINLDYRDSQLKLICNTLDNLLIVNELFTDEIYEFNFNKRLVCIDIGMNVGYSSLLFSTRNDIEKIYAYEPFKGTFDNALNNFKLNSLIANKINPINEGWSDKTGFFEFQNYEDGSVGASTSFTSELNNFGKIGKIVQVKLIDAANELKKIKQQNPDFGIFVKMDCEGSEYEIFERLEEEKLVDSVDGYLIEWHYKGAKPITEILDKYNFSYYSTGRPDSPFIGFIYAFKK